MNLYNQITDALSVADAKIAEQSKAWALHMLEQIKAYKASTSPTKWNYNEMFSICGGKIWYHESTYGASSLLAFVEKNCKNNSTKRNAKIALQLEKAGIVEVLSGGIVWNDNGFDGTFEVLTNQGIKRVIVETITAGGYNIQCFHLRVLVKIK